SHSQDTAGPMARTVADAAALLGAIAGHDPRDPASKDTRTHGDRALALLDFTNYLGDGGLKGTRIGVARKFFGFNDRVDKLMEEAVSALKSLGATVVDPADLPTHGKMDAPEFEVLLYEFKADLNKHLAGLPPGDHPRTLKALIEFNERHRDREMPYFGQELFIRSEAKGPLTEPAYKKALRDSKLLSQAQGIDAVMRRNNLHALVAPTGGPAWTTDLVNGDHFTGGSSTPAAVAGYPNVQVPAGFVYGLPVGISFFGRAYSEPHLIRIAHAYEQATRHRRPPRFLPDADLTS
ncbi:MAG TPA: amidase family protein, partial [Pyrinomonadaceae bacterium]|nr:amidase family protein [Pyrinomonadaceae bacterium]